MLSLRFEYIHMCIYILDLSLGHYLNALICGANVDFEIGNTKSFLVTMKLLMLIDLLHQTCRVKLL